jgi:transposase
LAACLRPAWVKTFVTGGETALTSFHYIGGEGWLTDDQQHQFTLWLDAGVRSTAEAITWVREQFGYDYSGSGMRKLLKRLDYRYRQPDVLAAKADPEAQAAWVETYTSKRGADTPWAVVFPGCRAPASHCHPEPRLD